MSVNHDPHIDDRRWSQIVNPPSRGQHARPGSSRTTTTRSVPARHARPARFPETLTVRETAEILHMSHKSVYALIDRGRLRCARPSPRKILVYEEDVLRLLKPING